MGVYIKDMEMPKRGMVVNIYADGRVTNHFDEFGKTIGKAVPVPPHGKLIDADAIIKEIHETCKRLYGTDDITASPTLSAFKLYIGDAPTVIEAEEES